jgi:phosphatidylglycerol---prolipoprotein diacylglyceryl transferase
MYALALLMSAATTAATTGLPYFQLGALDIGLPIQAFGIIVASGLVIGAIPLRRYAEWHGVGDEHIRGLMTWVIVTGFIGAHVFDVVAYEWDRLDEVASATPPGWWFLPDGAWPSNWPLILRLWDGISSYGGFVGGALGFAVYVWWKRLPPRLFADITIIGLLPAFSIGRIGCTVVSDHIGAAVDPDAWYAFIAQDYPRRLNLAHLAEMYPGTSEYIRAWNLGLLEALYLLPVNILVLWLAFRPSKRQAAGFVTVLTGVLYAPVRFFLDFLRLEDSDPRYLGMTFAQWCSIVAFGVSIYVAMRIRKTGAPEKTVAPTSREAQAQLRIILREDDDTSARQEADKKAEAERKKAEIARLRAERDREDAEFEAAERAKAALADRQKVAVEDPAVGADGDADGDDEDDDGAEVEVASTPAPAAKRAPRTSGAAKGGAAKGAGGKSSAGKSSAGKSSAGKSSAGKSSAGKNRKR